MSHDVSATRTESASAEVSCHLPVTTLCVWHLPSGCSTLPGVWPWWPPRSHLLPHALPDPSNPRRSLFPVPFTSWASLLPFTSYKYTLRLLPWKKFPQSPCSPSVTPSIFTPSAIFYSGHIWVAGCDRSLKFQTYSDNTLDLSTWMFCGKLSPNVPQSEVNIPTWLLFLLILCRGSKSKIFPQLYSPLYSSWLTCYPCFLSPFL